jgi:hypothetical protein
MKQHRFTSASFVPEGEQGHEDAVMHPDDLREIRKLAGLPVQEAMGGVYTGYQGVYNSDNGPSQSPVGSNITNTAAYRNSLLEKYQVRPGDYLWFLINFEPVRGLGEAAGHLEQKIQAYLDRHPEERPENRPRPPGQ